MLIDKFWQGKCPGTNATFVVVQLLGLTVNITHVFGKTVQGMDFFVADTAFVRNPFSYKQFTILIKTIFDFDEKKPHFWVCKLI